ncbi:MAG: hypothetical protein AAFV07_16005, partial [Bacteroidota bacterium]
MQFLLRWSRTLMVLGCVLVSVPDLHAQGFAHAGEYMDLFSVESDRFHENLWSYIRTASHSKRANKIERERQKLLLTIKNVQRKVKATPA